MVSMRIPKEATPAVRALAELDEESWKKLHSRLSSQKDIVSSDELVSLLEELHLSQLDKFTIRWIVDLVIGLRGAIDEMGRDPSIIVNGILTSLKSAQDLSSVLKDDRVLRTRLETLLDPTNALALLARSRNLESENERSFIGARIVTDARPVFGASVEEPPIAFLLQHTLKLTFRQNMVHKEFYVVLSDSDLEVLGSAVKRARTKTKTLTNTISATGIQLIPAEED